jgi:hypothetical protein
LTSFGGWPFIQRRTFALIIGHFGRSQNMPQMEIITTASKPHASSAAMQGRVSYPYAVACSRQRPASILLALRVHLCALFSGQLVVKTERPTTVLKDCSARDILPIGLTCMEPERLCKIARDRPCCRAETARSVTSTPPSSVMWLKMLTWITAVLEQRPSATVKPAPTRSVACICNHPRLFAPVSAMLPRTHRCAGDCCRAISCQAQTCFAV